MFRSGARCHAFRFPGSEKEGQGRSSPGPGPPLPSRCLKQALQSEHFLFPSCRSGKTVSFSRAQRLKLSAAGYLIIFGSVSNRMLTASSDFAAENTFYSVISQVLPGQRCLQLEHPPQDKSKRVKQIKDARQPCPCFDSVILLDLCDGLQKATRHCK